MAFDPIKGQFFRIRSVLSGLVLQVQDNSGARGAQIVQDEQIADDSKAHHQHFQFVAYGQGFYTIRARSSNKNLDVANLSQDDGARVIQWDVTPGQGNQQFTVMPAGHNRYFISAHHSLKLLAVNGGATPKGAPLTQGSGKNADYQFTFEPVAPIAERGLREVVLLGSDEFRDGALTLLSKVETVGGGLKFVAELMWPDSRPPFIDQVRDYVLGIARQLIEENNIKNLESALKGFNNVLSQYLLASKGLDKATWMTSMISTLEAAQPYFFNQSSPEKTLSHLVTMGTLHLSILRERYDRYVEIYDKEPENRQALLKDLQDRVKLYVKGCDAARAATLAWRLSKISWHSEVRYGPNQIAYDAFIASDEFDGWVRVHSEDDLTNAQLTALAVADRDARIAHVTEHFNVELDTLFGAALLWRYYDPALKETPRDAHSIVKSTLFGNAEGDYFETPSKPDQASPLFAIDIYVRDDGNAISGIRVTPRDNTGSHALYGSASGKRHTLSLDHKANDEDPDEVVLAAWGNHEPLSSLYLFSSLWNDAGGGQRHRDNCWTSEPPTGADGRLDSIFGYTSGGRITGIGFKWRCTKKV